MVLLSTDADIHKVRVSLEGTHQLVAWEHLPACEDSLNKSRNKTIAALLEDKNRVIDCHTSTVQLLKVMSSATTLLLVLLRAITTQLT